MTRRLIRFAVTAVALLLASLLVPDIVIDWGEKREGAVVTLVAVAGVFGLVNAFIRPVARLASIPLNILSLGLFSVVLNAALLLLAAYLVDVVFGPLIVIAGFPPQLSLDTLGTAAVGSFIISAISAGLLVLIPDA
jgi:putative membrane protein